MPLCGVATVKIVRGKIDRQLLSVYLDRGVIRFTDVDERRTNPTSNDLTQYQAVDPGDFVLNNQQAWRGSVGVSSLTGIVSPAYLVLSLRTGIHPHFANYLFRSKEAVGQYMVCSRGVGTIQRNLYWPSLKRVTFSVPPIHEQAAIVRFLDHADQRIRRYIQAKERLIELLEEQQQAIIHQAVTGQIDVRTGKPYPTYKNSGVEWLGKVPKNWRLVPLKWVAQGIQNGATPPTSELTYYEEGTVPWYGPSSIMASEEVGPPIKHLTDLAFSEGGARLLCGPSLLVGVIGNVGQMALMKKDGATNQQITAFELPVKLVSPRFLLRQLRGAEAWLRSSASAATIPILDSSTLTRLPCAIPSLDEQHMINAALDPRIDGIHRIVSSNQSLISLAREYRTRLIAEVVTGKLDVREAAASLPKVDPLEVENKLDDALDTGGEVD